MTPSPSTVRTVQCYHCHRHFDVPGKAMSLSCPWCYRRVTLSDIVVKDECFAKALQTCGRIVVQKKGRLVASLIEARLGVETFGVIEGKVRSGCRLYIGPQGRLRGDAIAPSIWIEPGGAMEGGLLHIGPAPEQPGEHASGDHERRTAAGFGFDARSAKEAGEKLRVVLSLRNGRTAGFKTR